LPSSRSGTKIAIADNRDNGLTVISDFPTQNHSIPRGSSSHMPVSKITLVFTVSLLVLLSIDRTSNASDRVVVFGDSWGVLTAPSLQKTFDLQAPGNDVLSAAHLGERATDMITADPEHGLPYIASTLAAHPTADLVHLSIGGNDLRSQWTAGMSPADEDELLTSISDNVETIAAHIVAQRPDIEVLYSSYTYARPSALGTPLEVNTVLEELQSRVDARLQNIPRATAYNFYGLMQTLWGQSEFGLPPGDPSLPDINLPGPPEAFIDDIHLTLDLGQGGGPFGYDQLADEQFSVFYASRLVPEPGAFVLLVFAAIAFHCVIRRRSVG